MALHINIMIIVQMHYAVHFKLGVLKFKLTHI